MLTLESLVASFSVFFNILGLLYLMYDVDNNDEDDDDDDNNNDYDGNVSFVPWVKEYWATVA